MSARLTNAERQLRALTESDWQGQVFELARLYGYSYVHFRAARTSRGWRVPVEGPLGQGWPDVVLFRPGRTIYAELKREKGNDCSPEQLWVHEQIRAAGNEVYVWRPSQLDDVIRVLQEAQE